jgi:hypothetical protein
MVGNQAAFAPAAGTGEPTSVVEQLRAELAAANDAITDLLHDLHLAQAAGYTPWTGDGTPSSVWW